MFPRFRIAMGLALILALVLTVPVFAGGWAVIVLDELPTNIVAGEPLTIGFTVLQHGRSPMDGLEPIITANLYKEQEFVVFAEPDGKPGHYTATITFPKEGEWRWYIEAFSMKQLMPMLTVAAPVGGAVSLPATQTASQPAAAVPLYLIVRVLAIGIGLAGLFLVFRRRSRLAIALTALSLLVGAGTFMAESAVPEVEAQGKPSYGMTSDPNASQIETGRRLFVAKGCITCHFNTKVHSYSEYMTVEVGPNLTKFSASPEALRLRLKDPASVKSDTQMPNLNLSEEEIEALIAFINAK
jgi:mono/diheme cytochrome c family protein